MRAQRWQHDMQLKGMNYSLHTCEQIISERDKRDQERKIAPLVIPQDAIVIDTSLLSIEQIVTKMMEYINGCSPSEL